ncbi:unnamed protein product [Camellia sinensis]
MGPWSRLYNFQRYCKILCPRSPTKRTPGVIHLHLLMKGKPTLVYASSVALGVVNISNSWIFVPEVKIKKMLVQRAYLIIQVIKNE